MAHLLFDVASMFAWVFLGFTWLFIVIDYVEVQREKGR